MEFISVTDTAKLVRAELKKHFPNTKFSVRSDKYAGGASIRVEWTDGATVKRVEDVAGHFHGSEFDGMRDLKYSNKRPYLNDFIIFERILSAASEYKIAILSIEKYNLNVKINKALYDIHINNERLNGEGCYTLSNLVHRESQNISFD